LNGPLTNPRFRIQGNAIAVDAALNDTAAGREASWSSELSIDAWPASATNPPRVSTRSATPDPLRSSHRSISSTSPRSMFHNCAVSR
jgi:hypothetical protein